MFQFKTRPYHLLLLTAVPILIASFFVLDQTIDIHLQDTYFIIALPQIFWGTIMLLLVFWTLYLWTKSILLSKVLTWSHIILLILTAISLVSFSFYFKFNGLAGPPLQDYGNRETIMQSDYIAKGVVIIILLMVLGIVLFITNLGFGVFKKWNSRRNSS